MTRVASHVAEVLLHAPRVTSDTETTPGFVNSALTLAVLFVVPPLRLAPCVLQNSIPKVGLVFHAMKIVSNVLDHFLRIAKLVTMVIF